MVFAWYVIHEVSDQVHLMQEVHTLLVPEGTFLIVEPKFEVSASEFEKTIGIAVSAGFHLVDVPSVLMSRAAMLRKG